MWQGRDHTVQRVKHGSNLFDSVWDYPLSLEQTFRSFASVIFLFLNTDWSVTASDGNPAVESWSNFCHLLTAHFEQKVGPLDAVTELECKKELGLSYQFHRWEPSASF